MSAELYCINLRGCVDKAGVTSLAAKQVWPWAGKRHVQILLQIVEILSTFCNNFSTGLNVGVGGAGAGGGTRNTVFQLLQQCLCFVARFTVS